MVFFLLGLLEPSFVFAQVYVRVRLFTFGSSQILQKLGPILKVIVIVDHHELIHCSVIERSY